MTLCTTICDEYTSQKECLMSGCAGVYGCFDGQYDWEVYSEQPQQQEEEEQQLYEENTLNKPNQIKKTINYTVYYYFISEEEQQTYEFEEGVVFESDYEITDLISPLPLRNNKTFQINNTQLQLQRNQDGWSTYYRSIPPFVNTNSSVPKNKVPLPLSSISPPYQYFQKNQTYPIPVQYNSYIGEVEQLSIIQQDESQELLYENVQVLSEYNSEEQLEKLSQEQSQEQVQEEQEKSDNSKKMDQSLQFAQSFRNSSQVSKNNDETIKISSAQENGSNESIFFIVTFIITLIPIVFF